MRKKLTSIFLIFGVLWAYAAPQNKGNPIESPHLYVESYTVTKKTDSPGVFFESYDELGELEYTINSEDHDAYTMTWKDGAGGDGSDYWNWSQFISDDEGATGTGNGSILYHWPTNHWPDLAEGTAEYAYQINWTNQPSVVGSYTNAVGAAPVTFENGKLNCRTNLAASYYDDYGGYERGGTISHQRESKIEMRLATGGKPGSTREGLFCIEATASNWIYVLDEEYALQQVPLGGVAAAGIVINGQALGSDGKLWMALPDNDDVEVTPMAKSADYYTFDETIPEKYSLRPILLAMGGAGSHSIQQDNGAPASDYNCALDSQGNVKPDSEYPILYESVTWETTPPDSYPTLTGSVYMEATPTFRVYSTGSAPIVLRGKVSGTPYPCTFWQTNTPNSQPSWTTSIRADNPITPNRVDYYPSMTVEWKIYSPDLTVHVDVGTTECPVYVSLKPPTTSDLYRTVVHLACSQGSATTEADALANTWGQFAGPANVKTWDGTTKLYYYKPQGDPSLNLSGLLSTHDGECGAWVELLIASLNVNGINANKTTVARGIDYFHPSGDETYFSVGAITLTPETSPGDAPPFTNTIAQSSDNLGQNTHPPGQYIFNVHWLVHPGISGSIYYDPSYGKTYADSDDFNSSAISAWSNNKTVNDVDWANSKDVPNYRVDFHD